MTGNVLLIHAKSKKMVASLKAVGVSQIPLAERARNLVGVAVAISDTCDVHIGFCASRNIGASEGRWGIERAWDTEGGVKVSCRR